VAALAHWFLAKGTDRCKARDAADARMPAADEVIVTHPLSVVSRVLEARLR
jgi:hypothetical protein